MGHYFIYLSLHFLCCLIFFFGLQRTAFMLYNRKSNPGRLTRRDIRDIYLKGLSTDLVGAAYMTALPWLFLWLQAEIGGFAVTVPLIVIDVIVGFIISMTSLADMALYPFWKFKIDSSVFAYLKSLKGATASVSAGYIVAATVAELIIWGGLTMALIGLMGLSGVKLAEPLSGWQYLWGTLLFILFGGLLFAFIRGIEHRPKTPCQVYYSNNMYYNHSALNPLYNLVYSFSVTDHPDKQFKFMDAAECDAKVKEMFPTAGTPRRKLLTTDRPNILFIVWESLNARFIEPLGGRKGVMENFNRLSEEGVFFTHVDAGSFRTDRGLVCLLSGYLGQPTMSIIRNTKKLPSLPALPRKLKEAGYHTAAFHGGDLKIMHKNDYYIVSGHDEVTGIEAMPADAPSCRWGVHDNFTFDYVADRVIEMSKSQSPFLFTFQTLSSHEPYRVPFSKFDHNISNAFAFSDDAFGKMVERLKGSEAWRDLLIVVVGDHGLNCSDEPIARNEYPHIPILLLGGAVKEPVKIDTIMGQTDLAATLLGQLGLSHEEFIFSRDVLAETYTYPFALHTYNNGFLFRDATGYTDYDNTAAKAVEGADAERELKGRMILQTLYDDITRR